MSFDELRTEQDGVVTRAQALTSGLTVHAIRAHVRAGRWRRMSPGVYWTHTGPVPRPAQLWAAVLGLGRDATLSHETAAELCGLLDRPSDPIHVSVPADRRVRSRPGTVVHLRRNMPAARPARTPARTGVDDTVVDLTQSAAGVDDAIAWIARACAARLTTPDRLRRAFAARPWLRWREALTVAVADVADGCHSILELRYLRDVERGHALPRGSRQVRRRTGYSDVEYEEFALVVELDGRAWHDGEARARDRRRDNRTSAGGRRTLRYGWADVNVRPCDTAAEVSAALRLAGWPGTPQRCSATCRATKA